jgi:hypothetical protein
MVEVPTFRRLLGHLLCSKISSQTNESSWCCLQWIVLVGGHKWKHFCQHFSSVSSVFWCLIGHRPLSPRNTTSQIASAPWWNRRRRWAGAPNLFRSGWRMVFQPEITNNTAFLGIMGGRMPSANTNSQCPASHINSNPRQKCFRQWLGASYGWFPWPPTVSFSP